MFPDPDQNFGTIEFYVEPEGLVHWFRTFRFARRHNRIDMRGSEENVRKLRDQLTGWLNEQAADRERRATVTDEQVLDLWIT